MGKAINTITDIKIHPSIEDKLVDVVLVDGCILISVMVFMDFPNWSA